MLNPLVCIRNSNSLIQIVLLTILTIFFYSCFFLTTVEASSSKQPQSLVAVEDPVLENWIRNRINKPTGELTTSDWLGISEIELNESGLTSLVGLENAINLERVEIRDNRITDLTPLKGLPRLRDLEIGNNLVTDLSPLVGLPSISYINAYNNRITDISPLTAIIPLRNAYFSNNNITDLSPLANVQTSNLRNLSFDSNRIIDASPLSNLPKLEYLGLGYNNIRDISFVKDLPNLNNLSISGNNITDITPLSNATFLEYLYLAGNKITDITPLANLQYLENLNLSQNNITNLDSLGNLQYLRRLEFYDSNLTDISFLKSITFIEEIRLSNNRITNIEPLRNLQFLQGVFLEGNRIQDITPLLQNGNLVADTEIVLNDNPLSQESVNMVSNLRARGINVEAPAFGVPTPTPTPVPPTPTPTPPANAVIFENLEFESKIREMIGKDKGYVLTEDVAKITEINLENVQFGHIRDIKHFTNLTKLSLRGAGIYDLEGIGNLQKLERLTLSENNLVNIQRLAQLKSLRNLILYNNQISDISSLTPASLPNLSSLFLDGNNISDISPLMPSDGNLIEQLCCIGIGNNPLDTQNIDWSELFHERILNIQIGALKFNDENLNDLFSAEHGFSSLKFLNLSNNNITDITPLLEIEGLGKDASVFLRNNMIDESEFDNPIQTLTERGVTVNYDNQRLQTTNTNTSNSNTSDSGSSSNADGTCNNPGDWVQFVDRGLFGTLTEALQNAGIRYCSDLNSTKITRLPLEQLTELDANNRGIRYLDGLEALINLTLLDLRGNNIGAAAELWPLDSLYNLRQLNLRENQIFDASPIFKMMALSNLEVLELNDNNLVTLQGIENLYNLRVLTLADNAICQEGFNPFDFIRGNSNLLVLDIGYQQKDQCITDINFLYDLPNLVHLSIGDSDVNDLWPLSAMRSIDFLNLSDTRSVNDYSVLLNLNYQPNATISLMNSNAPEDIYRQLGNMGLNLEGNVQGGSSNQNMSSNVISDTSGYRYLNPGEGSDVRQIELIHNNNSAYSGFYNIEPYEYSSAPVYMKDNCNAGGKGTCYIFKYGQGEWVLQAFPPGTEIEGNTWLANDVLQGMDPWNGVWGGNVQSVRITIQNTSDGSSFNNNNSTSINNNTNNDGFFIEDEGNSRGFLFNVDDVPEWAQNMGLNDVNQLLDPTVIAIFGIFLTLLGTVAQMVRGR